MWGEETCEGVRGVVARPKTTLFRLDYHFTINVNNTAGGDINVVPSAAGIRLFTTVRRGKEGGRACTATIFDAHTLFSSPLPPNRAPATTPAGGGPRTWTYGWRGTNTQTR